MDISKIRARPNNRFLQRNLHMEYIPKDRIKYLLVKSRELNLDRKLIKHLVTMCNLLDSMGRLEVSCHFPDKGIYGRLVPSHPSLSTLWRKTRNTLIWDLYYDIDMVNAHPSILVSILRRCADAPMYRHWLDYVENRENVIHRLETDYPNVLREGETWKTKIVSLLYGSGDTCNIELLINLRSEMRGIYDYIRRKQPEEFIRFIDNCKRKTEEAVENRPGKFICFYLQNFEMDIVDEVVEEFFGCKEYMSYEYDGCKIWKEYVDTELGGIDSLLERMNETVQQKFEYVRFSNKDMSERFEIDLEELENVRGMLIDLSTDEAMVDVIERARGDDIVFKNEESWFFNGMRWVYSEKKCWELKNRMYRIVYEYIQRFIDEDNPLYETIKKDLESLKKGPKRNSVYEMCIARFQKHHLEFDRSPHLLGFNNGVYDLLAGTFRENRNVDFVTMSVGYDYVSIVDEELEILMMVILRKIHLDEDILELYIQVLCSALLGKNPSLFFCFTASGRNGKSMMDELMLETLGQYATKMLVCVLTNEMKGGPVPEMAKIHLKRFVYMEEPEQNTKMSNANIKYLTGSEIVNARNCNSNDDTQTNYATIVMEANSLPQLKEQPKVADTERIVIIPFKSFFGKNTLEDDYENRSFVQDRTYTTSEWRKRMRMTFMHILLKKYEEWKARNYKFTLPNSVSEASQEYLLRSNPFECIHKYLFVSGNIYERCGCVGECHHSINWMDLLGFIKDRDNDVYGGLARNQQTDVSDPEKFMKFLLEEKNYEFTNRDGPLRNYILKRFKLVVYHREELDGNLPL